MIFFNFIYLLFYIICKKFASKYFYDTPETYAIGFTSFLYTLSIEIFIHEQLKDDYFYNTTIHGVMFFGSLIGTIVLQYRYYVKTKRYMKLLKKFKYWPLIMIPIVGGWIYLIYYYYRFKYLNF